MMEEGMSYTEFYKLKEDDPDRLLELYYFVIERRKAVNQKFEESRSDKPKGRTFVRNGR